MESGLAADRSLEPILQFARELHTAGDPVLQFLPWAQVEGWLLAEEWEKLRFLLRKLPLAIIPDRPEFFYMRGQAFWGQHRLEEAHNLFEKAHYYYRMTRDDLILSALSCIDIADIAHSRRQYQTATHYLQVASTLLAATPTINPYVTTRQDLIQAVVLHDLGRLQAAIDHAQAAYVGFEILKDAPSQLFCLMSIATAALQMGNLELATSQLAVARSLFEIDAIPALYFARILNTEVHIAWHRADLTQALLAAEALFRYATQHAIPHQRLYATVLQGHVQRSLGNYTAAGDHYAAAQQIADSIGYTAYLTELSLQEAWLHLLAGEIEEAREQLQRAADRMEVGQWMSANIVLGVADLLDGAGDAAVEPLSSALTYFSELEAATVVCAIRCYLALIAFRRGEHALGQEHGNAALRWLNEHNLTWFPAWWHPGLLAVLAAYALQHCVAYIHVLHRFCVDRLGAATLGPLTVLLHNGDPAVQLRAQRILDAIQHAEFADLSFVQESHIRAVLMQLLAEHKLRRAGLPLLFTRLTTAEHQRTPNATLVAVFGLYLAGQPREAIAAHLHCSEQLVRNYISEIYARFGVTQAEWPERRARYARLRTLAREAGFV